MSMLNRRLQVLIDEERYRRLASRAREEGVSVATLVRRAIDAMVGSGSARRKKAAADILAATPMDVPDDPADLRREVLEDRTRDF
jgi:hypothetical protein